MTQLCGSVGRDGCNQWHDVLLVQQLLNQNMVRLIPLAPPSISGTCDTATIGIIAAFQSRVVFPEQHIPKLASGRVDPGDSTWLALNGRAIGPGANHQAAARNSIHVLETEAIHFGTRWAKDSRVREAYVAQAKAFAKELRGKLASGLITPHVAAEQASAMRNEIQEAARLRSSDIARDAVGQLRASGKTLPELQSSYARNLFGSEFEALAESQRNAVFLAIVESSGRISPGLTARASRFGKFGKGLLILSEAIAVYNVAAAEDKVHAAETLFGAAAGAPVGAPIFAFVGGAAGALGADFAYDSVVH